MTRPEARGEKKDGGTEREQKNPDRDRRDRSEGGGHLRPCPKDPQDHEAKTGSAHEKEPPLART